MMNQNFYPGVPGTNWKSAGAAGEGRTAFTYPDGRREPCDLCGILCTQEELQQYGMFILCPECGMAYCDACFQDYGDAFIEENAHIFYTGWFEGLSDEEQLEVLKAAYRTCYRGSDRLGRAQMREERREFCTACVNEAWPVYVVKRLNSACSDLLN